MKFLIQPLYNWYRTLLRHPQYRWLVVFASLLYLLSPINLATDAIPVVGWIDDGVIATLLISEVAQFMLEQRKNRQAKSADPNALTA